MDLLHPQSTPKLQSTPIFNPNNISKTQIAKNTTSTKSHAKTLLHLTSLVLKIEHRPVDSNK